MRHASRMTSVGALALMALLMGGGLAAQDLPAERTAAIAVADAALAAISRGDLTALTDLMLPEAVLFQRAERAFGGAG